ncbi:nucleotidyltransferase family protein [Micromonospora sp. NPDC049799]|uniref:nucleotidyltransferase family protein n=1 Tax=Micromonospora sp. NPDC049799 TaxID=3154741 RepID=UPI0033F96779
MSAPRSTRRPAAGNADFRSPRGHSWRARNQAAVHTWYAARFGGEPIAPYRSVAEAVATWPEFATAVAVRLNADDRLVVCAPHGLADLLGGVWRHNPTMVDGTRFGERLAQVRPADRWPGVTVVRPPQPRGGMP